MRTFLAFKLKVNYEGNEFLSRMNKLRNYYQNGYLNYKLKADYWFLNNIGMFIIDDENSAATFPTKIQMDNLCSLIYTPPLNYRDFGVSKSSALNNILLNLNDNSQFSRRLTSPYMLASIDSLKEQLSIHTDLLGVSRLYELETKEGIFWSNRPSALHIFAQKKAEYSENSWKIYALTGWFLDNLSPFKDVYRLPAGITINAKSDVDSDIEKNICNATKHFLNDESLSAVDLDYLIKDTQNNIKNFLDLWDLPLETDVSGGKDSRVSLAYVLNSDTQNIIYRTINDIDEELNTSKQLFTSLNIKPEINVLDPSQYIDEQPSLTERVDRLLFEHDGDFSTVMMSSPIIETNNYFTQEKVRINGFGGEVGKGAYYSNIRWIDKLEPMGDKAAFFRLSSYLRKIGCAHPESEHLMDDILNKILDDGKRLGYSGLKLLDYFHYVERFRRWTPLSGELYSFSPFISKYFLKKALDNTPLDNMNSTLHTDVINHLVPEWKNIDFFKATPEQSKEKDRKNIRLWQTKDKNDIEKYLESSNLWNDIFDEVEVLELWEEAKLSGIPNFKETLFQRVALKAQFNSHLNRINNSIK